LSIKKKPKQRWHRELPRLMTTQIVITLEIAKNFKLPYNKKMGGTQTIVMPDGQRFYFDDRDYYKGRGASYNSASMHDYKGEIIVTQDELEIMIESLEERERLNKAIREQREKEATEKKQRMETAEKQGKYSIMRYDYGTFVELSDEEIFNKTFDAQRLANTLNISVHDAELLKSEGKTYVYAETTDGNIIELYHSDLCLNSLSISVNFKAKEIFNQKLSERESWVNAPFAKEVGQTESLNHFVC